MKICHEVIVILPGCTAEKSAVFFDFLHMVSLMENRSMILEQGFRGY